MGKSFDVENNGLEDFLGKDGIAFSIPRFQRRYAWGKVEVTELINDVFYGEKWILADSNEPPYFLGSLVFSFAEDKTLQVLDGQQRLTSITLLLSVLKFLLNQENYKESADIDKFLWSGKMGEGKTLKLRLQPEDQPTYTSLVNNPEQFSKNEFKHTALGIAAKTTFETIEEILGTRVVGPRTRKDLLEQMAKRLMYNLEFVTIESASEGEAFRLFETLNDRGLALSAADLIKTKLLSRCDSNLQDVFDTWNSMVDTVSGREIINFLRYHWIAERTFVRKDDLYDNYKAEIAKLGAQQASEFADELKESASFFSEIVDPKPAACQWGTEVGESLLSITRFGAKSLRPALLACAKYKPDEMKRFVLASESIIFRFSLVAERNPNQLEISFNNAAKAIRENKNTIDEIVKNLVTELELPNDPDARQILANKLISTPSVQWREVLARINKSVSTGEIVDDRKKVHIEHILSQNPNDKALKEAKLTMEEAQELNARLGNLTLLSGKKNQQGSNREFSHKRTIYSTSEIAMTKVLADLKKWTEVEIDERTNQLIGLCLACWPWPA